ASSSLKSSRRRRALRSLSLFMWSAPLNPLATACCNNATARLAHSSFDSDSPDSSWRAPALSRAENLHTALCSLAGGRPEGGPAWVAVLRVHIPVAVRVAGQPEGTVQAGARSPPNRRQASSWSPPYRINCKPGAEIERHRKKCESTLSVAALRTVAVPVQLSAPAVGDVVRPDHQGVLAVRQRAPHEVRPGEGQHGHGLAVHPRRGDRQAYPAAPLAEQLEGAGVGRERSAGRGGDTPEGTLRRIG